MIPLNTRILIMDNNPVVRERIQKGIGNSPVVRFEASQCATGVEGQRLIAESLLLDKPFAAIFMDIQMPDWDGLTTALKIRNLDRRIELIFTSSLNEMEPADLNLLMRSEVGSYSKSFSPADICKVAVKAIHDWNRQRILESLIDKLCKMHVTDNECCLLSHNIFAQITDCLGVRNALLLQLDTREPVALLGLGARTFEDYRPLLGERTLWLLSQPRNFDQGMGIPELIEENGIFSFHFGPYAVIMESLKDNFFNRNRLYLLEAFVSRAICHPEIADPTLSSRAV